MKTIKKVLQFMKPLGFWDFWYMYICPLAAIFAFVMSALVYTGEIWNIL